MKRKMGRSDSNPSTKSSKYEYGDCRIPTFDGTYPDGHKTMMISPLNTCAQYIIHAHGCRTKVVKNELVNFETMKDINIITYTPLGETLSESCARRWHDYLVRRRPQFKSTKKKFNPPQVVKGEQPPCRPYNIFYTQNLPYEILIKGDNSGNFHSGVLDITNCCNRQVQRDSWDEHKGIQAPIVMTLKSKFYRLSSILKEIKKHNMDFHQPKNIYVHLLTCLGDSPSYCDYGNECYKPCNCYQLSGDQLAMYGHCQTCLNE